MLRYLDEGLDELAAIAHEGAALRVGLTLGMGGLAVMMAPPFQVAVWVAATLAAEMFAWFATMRQARREAVPIGIRAAYALSLFAVVNCWTMLGAMLWTSGAIEGAASGAIMWLSVIFFAQTWAYQSRAGLVIGGLWPMIVIPLVVVLGPNPLHFRMAPMLGMLALAFLFAGDGVIRMSRARRGLDEAHDRLRASEAEAHMLADNVVDVIAMNTLSGKRLYLSPSITRVMGYTVEELYQTPNYTFLHPEDAKWLPREIRRMVETRGEMTQQYRVICKDGRSLWVETNFSVLPGGGPNEEPRVISVSRPIDGRKALETELVEARFRAEQAAAAKSDFLANMTHELRTPLNAIVGFSGVLRGSPRLDGEDARHVELIHQASGTLLELVNSVLDFSKLEAGAAVLEERPFDPTAEARAVARLLAETAAAKGLSLSVRTEGETRPLSGDSAKLRHVMLNFLSNGMKFTERGGVTVTVHQSAASESHDRLRVEVADSGIGLAPDQIDHLFDRFTQADASVSRRYGGTGLGLAICKRTLDLMGGLIGAESHPGEGATFWFEVVLPRSEAPAEKEAADPSPALERPLRLLVVEDVAVNRELILTLLRPFDVEIETAENGAQAVEAMGRGAYDLVLMDVQMPVMDGLSATRAIRASGAPAGQSTPIIAMTANVLPEQVQTCLAAGMDDHLGKPINPADLLAALSRWSEGREAGKAQALAG